MLFSCVYVFKLLQKKTTLTLGNMKVTDKTKWLQKSSRYVSLVWTLSVSLSKAVRRSIVPDIYGILYLYYLIIMGNYCTSVWIDTFRKYNTLCWSFSKINTLQDYATTPVNWFHIQYLSNRPILKENDWINCGYFIFYWWVLCIQNNRLAC